MVSPAEFIFHTLLTLYDVLVFWVAFSVIHCHSFAMLMFHKQLADIDKPVVIGNEHLPCCSRSVSVLTVSSLLLHQADEPSARLGPAAFSERSQHR